MLFLVLCVMVPAIEVKTRLPAMYFNPEIIERDGRTHQLRHKPQRFGPVRRSTSIGSSKAPNPRQAA